MRANNDIFSSKGISHISINQNAISFFETYRIEYNECDCLFLEEEK